MDILRWFKSRESFFWHTTWWLVDEYYFFHRPGFPFRFLQFFSKYLCVGYLYFIFLHFLYQLLMCRIGKVLKYAVPQKTSQYISFTTILDGTLFFFRNDIPRNLIFSYVVDLIWSLLLDYHGDQYGTLYLMWGHIPLLIEIWVC